MFEALGAEAKGGQDARWCLRPALTQSFDNPFSTGSKSALRMPQASSTCCNLPDLLLPSCSQPSAVNDDGWRGIAALRKGCARKTPLHRYDAIL